MDETTEMKILSLSQTSQTTADVPLVKLLYVDVNVKLESNEIISNMSMFLKKYQSSEYECHCCGGKETCYKFNEATLTPTELNEGQGDVTVACVFCLSYALKNKGQCPFKTPNHPYYPSCPFKH
jgi:hypothetical protein